MDWAKVNNGVFNPTNIAILNGQRFVNYAAGTIAWFAIALFWGHSSSVTTARSSTNSVSDYIPSLIGSLTKEDTQSWLRNAFENQDNTNFARRTQSVEDLSSDDSKSEHGDILSWAFDPKTKLVNMIRSFANAVEAYDGQLEEF